MKNKYERSFKSSVFNIIVQFIKIYKTNHCKIDSIERQDNDYLIKFYYVGKRQIFVKSASQIYNNIFLLNEFPPDEAALIGLYSAIEHYKHQNINRKMRNEQ